MLVFFLIASFDLPRDHIQLKEFFLRGHSAKQVFDARVHTQRWVFIRLTFLLAIGWHIHQQNKQEIKISRHVSRSTVPDTYLKRTRSVFQSVLIQYSLRYTIPLVGFVALVVEVF